MKYEVDGYICDVIIEKKHNKNTYIRVKNDLNIYVSTSFLVTKAQIKTLLDKNYSFLVKSLNNQIKIEQKKESFYYLGIKYDIIFYDNKNIEIIGNRIYIKNKDCLDKWLKKEINSLFKDRLDYNYNLFTEKIPFPSLKIRKMKSRWGVCNKKDNSITLNLELIKYDITKLDYVIIHELSHFIHFNHSNEFWKQVEKYFPNYKKIRKELKD